MFLLAQLYAQRYVAHMGTEEHVSVAEAAAIRGVHPATIKRWIQSGKLPAERVGNLMWLIRRSDLDETAA
jgi:excisionase family DNA binding protein